MVRSALILQISFLVQHAMLRGRIACRAGSPETTTVSGLFRSPFRDGGNSIFSRRAYGTEAI